ncbi:glycosyltransferase [Pseudarthrobacter sp. WHRI 8279]|uniref:glycosyltransferase n=1 Tax=Pseudarthrobacter sp. WHRI 8279 TaxID=3162566 RepID=UPI0032ECFA43
MNEVRNKKVVMWRRELLPGSETFVRSQIENLCAWRSLALGLDKVPSPLAADTDEVLFGQSFTDRMRRGLFTYTRLSWTLVRRLRQIKPDVVHAHFAMDGILIAPTCRQLGIPLIVSVYGIDVTALAARSGLRGYIYKRRLASTFKGASKILAVSKHLADAAIQLGAPRHKVVVHRLGIAVPDAVTRSDTSVWDWDVLVVGRLVEKKGIDDLIEAASSIARPDGSGVRVAVIGDGPLRQSLEERATLLGVHVDFLGGQSPSDVESIMNRSRVLAVPSKTAGNGDREGLPMILLEASARYMPIAATRHSGIPEFITHGVSGLLSEEKDIEALAANIRQLLKDEAYANTLASRARQKVATEYNIRIQSSILEQFYDDTVKSS